MNYIVKIDITANEANQRLDRFLRKYFKDVPLTEIYRMLRKKTVRVNGYGKKENYRLTIGDTVEIPLEKSHDKKADKIIEAGKDFDIVYEDENLLITDKPPGLIIHPDINHKENTLTDQVLYYLYKSGRYIPEVEKTFAPSPVNRLDVNTGGLVLFAKNYDALQALSEMVRERYVSKYYICAVRGIMKDSEIKSNLIKDTDKNIVVISDKKVEGSKEIHTKFKTLRTSGDYSLVEVELITGRSHQIRAQLADTGHPIIGDTKYGDKNVNEHFKRTYKLKGQFLYAYRLVFDKTTGSFGYLKNHEFNAKLPKTYLKILGDLFKYGME